MSDKPKSNANFMPMRSAPKAKPDPEEPVADKDFFDRLIKKASRKAAKPDGKTSESPTDAD